MRRPILQSNQMPSETKRVSGLSHGAEKLWRRTKSPLDFFPLLVEMIERSEIDVIQAMKIVRELRQNGLVVSGIDAEGRPLFRWAAATHKFN
jgi:hypothetical protein